MQCPRCAQANPSEAQFCNHCGGPLRLRCPGCGRANPPESRFCNGCGRALAEAPPPGAPDAEPRPERAQGPEPQPAASKTILVVEDRDDVRALARDILEDTGYRVLEAQDPNDALRIAEQHRATIDLLLTDLVMPQMSGIDLAKRLQSLRPDIQVLYMSGFVSSGVPAGELVKKPFKADALTQKVREVLAAPGKRRGSG
jgi:CheY-like chemotaxis protein